MVPEGQSHQVYTASHRQGDPFDSAADKEAARFSGKAQIPPIRTRAQRI